MAGFKIPMAGFIVSMELIAGFIISMASSIILMACSIT
jgi:hypothetical protein